MPRPSKTRRHIARTNRKREHQRLDSSLADVAHERPPCPPTDHLALTRKPMRIHPMKWTMKRLALPPVVAITIKERRARSSKGLLGDVPLKKKLGALSRASTTTWRSDETQEASSEKKFGESKRFVAQVRFPKVVSSFPTTSFYSISHQERFEYFSETPKTKLSAGAAKLAERFRLFLADLAAEEKSLSRGQLAATVPKQSLAEDVPAMSETTTRLKDAQEMFDNFDEWFKCEFPDEVPDTSELSGQDAFGDHGDAGIPDSVEKDCPAKSDSGKSIMNETSEEQKTADKWEKSRKRSRENSTGAETRGSENTISLPTALSPNASDKPPKKSTKKSSGSEQLTITDPESGSPDDVLAAPVAASWMTAEWRMPSADCTVPPLLPSCHLRDILTQMREISMFRQQVDSQEDLDELQNTLQLEFDESFKQCAQE